MMAKTVRLLALAPGRDGNRAGRRADRSGVRAAALGDKSDANAVPVDKVTALVFLHRPLNLQTKK